MNKTMSNFLFGFLAGAAAGAIAGILLAPDKGSTTRQNLRKKVLELSDEFGLGIGEMMEDMSEEPEPETVVRKPRAKREAKPAVAAKRKYVRKVKSEE
jgi:hypothetical protein